MSQENSNSQATPAAPVQTPPSPGNAEDLQARLAELERQNKGILNDLRQEREKRQEVEARYIAASSAVPSPAPQNDVNPGNELAALINPVVVPQINALKDEIKTMEAKAYLSTKLGKPWAEIESDPDFQNKLLSTSKRYGVSGDPYTATVRTYELMKRDEELESYRAKAAAAAVPPAPATSSLPAGSPPAQTQTVEYSLSDYQRLSVAEYDRMFASGSVRKVGDKIVFTPRS